MSGAEQTGRAKRYTLILEDACASCHGWTGVSPVIPFATLTKLRSAD
jgi:hypothetical protein